MICIKKAVDDAHGSYLFYNNIFWMDVRELLFPSKMPHEILLFRLLRHHKSFNFRLSIYYVYHFYIDTLAFVVVVVVVLEIQSIECENFVLISMLRLIDKDQAIFSLCLVNQFNTIYMLFNNLHNL